MGSGRWHPLYSLENWVQVNLLSTYALRSLIFELTTALTLFWLLVVQAHATLPAGMHQKSTMPICFLFLMRYVLCATFCLRNHMHLKVAFLPAHLHCKQLF